MGKGSWEKGIWARGDKGIYREEIYGKGVAKGRGVWEWGVQ